MQGWDASIATGLLGAHVGLDLPSAPQRHRADRQSRGVQRGADPPGGYRGGAAGLMAASSGRRASGTSRRRWLAVLLLLFLVSLPAVTAAHLRVRRGPVLLLPALALVRPRRLVRERVPALLRRRRHAQPRASTRPSSSGRPKPDGGSTSRTIGCAILWAPFYAVADVVAGARGGAQSPDGYSQPVRRRRGLRVGALRLPRAPRWRSPPSRRIGGRGSAVDEAGPAAALAVWLGTPLLFYMYVAPPMSHATLGVRRVALFVYVWLRVRETWTPRGLALLGALGGADGDGARAGRVLCRRTGLDFVLWFAGADRAPRQARRRRRASRRWRRSRCASCHRPSPTSRSTGTSGRRASSRAR